MSKLVSFVRSLYEKPQHRCLILGPGGAGKTAALYRMFLRELVVTIPTIGFNCEEVQIGRDVISFWDIGGCDRIRPLVRHYMFPGHSILFVIDTPACLAEASLLEYTLEELEFQCQAAAGTGVVFVGIALMKQDLLPVTQIEGGNSRLLPLVSKVKGVMEKVLPGGCGSSWDVFTNEDQGGLSAAVGNGFDDNWLITELLKGIKGQLKKKEGHVEEVKEVGGPKALSTDELRVRIETENESDPYTSLPPTMFLQKMESGDLETWDHRTHLRAGYYVVLEQIWAGHGLWKAAADFLQRLENMLANDARKAEAEKREKRFRNTVHRTMTTFYLHCIYIAILSFMDHQGSSHALPKTPQFSQFLLLHPHLMDSALWSQYYSKSLLFSPAARAAWRLPDLKPLPNYISLAPRPPLPTPTPTTPTTPEPEPDLLQRFALATLQRVHTTGHRRGKVIKSALAAFQKYTMTVRTQSPSVPPYSETQAYFWIQLLHAAIAGLGGAVDIGGLSFEAFVLLFPDLLRKREKGWEVWRAYYKESVWESVEARMGVVFPVLKALPDVVVPPGEAEREKAAVRELEVRKALTEGRRVEGVEMMLRVVWVLEEAQDEGEASHGEVLWRIFRGLWKAGKGGVGGVGNGLVGEEMRRRVGMVMGVTEKVFWVRVVLKKFMEFEITPGVDGDHSGGAIMGDFRRFLGDNRELALEELWKRFYSEETWKSEDAEERFVMPDLKEMPNFV